MRSDNYRRESVSKHISIVLYVILSHSRSSSKAVADGTIIWYCSNSVVKRTPWYSYGIEVLVSYAPGDPAHRKRKKVTWPTGQFCKGGWSQIIPKARSFH